jgi:hypothetical protein
MSRSLILLRTAIAMTRMRTAVAMAAGNLEVYRENLSQTPRRRVLSRSSVSVEGATLQRHGSRKGIAPWVAAKSCSKSLDATTYAPAARPVDFKNCCMVSGDHDGSGRHYFFQRVGSSTYALQSGSLSSRARVRRARHIAPAARLKARQPAAQRER